MSLLNQPLTIIPKWQNGVQARVQTGVLAQDRRVKTFYEAYLPDGTLVATFYIGHGIEIKGQSDLWRVMKQPNIESLMPPGGTAGDAVVSIFRGTTSLFGKVCRVTLGGDRLGGYVLEGNGWRGSRIRRMTDGVRLANIYAEGDPPEVFHLDPARTTAEIPLTAAYIVIYFLLEREIRHNSMVSRPTSTP